VSEPFTVTPRTTVKRLPERGSHDRDLVHAVLDEALICHVGFVVDGAPRVIPTIHARSGDMLFLHGSPASAMLRTLKDGVEVCVTVTLLDALVMARSAFHHSMNYRSVVVMGKAHAVTEPGDKRVALDALVDHVAAGRAAESRPPSDHELRSTLLLALPLDEASAKTRTGPPVDDDEDMDFPVWAGLIPLRTVAGAPVPDPLLRGREASPVITAWARPEVSPGAAR
jgi:nitroimidazol reductase NimA-like FMN-containing flavoprotein (pyridoxamine 5'-phosphate oxidase superfamily)